MKNIIIFLVIFLGILSGDEVFAADNEKLLTIINTETNEPATLYLRLDQGQVSGLKLVTLKYTKHFDYADVKSGTTLLKKSGISIISVKGINISPSSGGTLKLTYLKNFNLLGSTYGTIRINVFKSNQEWIMVHRGRKVSKLLLTPHPYGISSYQFN